VAQHIVKGFVEGMSKWLDASTDIEVAIAKDNTPLQSAKVLFAPDDTHLGVTSRRMITLDERNRGDIYVPSVDRLFRSAATAFGDRAMGILLSGMGKDGAEGLLDIRSSGGITIAQNSETSVVYGMPKVASKLGAAMTQMSPNDMIALLLNLHQRIQSNLGGRRESSGTE
jgi:chemotaxis response regulator CheB